jgi:hypothetical protein
MIRWTINSCQDAVPWVTIGVRGAAGPVEWVCEREHARSWLPECGWCHQRVDMGDGIYNEGEWMWGGCVSRYAHD